MPVKQLNIYCDESTEKGKYYSHFYGGVVIEACDREVIEAALNAEKMRLNLHKEVKWTYITKAYAEKYMAFIGTYFDLIQAGKIKVRIMFTQNVYVPVNLEEYQVDNQYFLLYYQLIKHAFGLRYCNPEQCDGVEVTCYLDDIPDSAEKFDHFKEHMSALSTYPVFKQARVTIQKHNIADVVSHDHVILQGLDIILGAMQFRLNNLHLAKPDGAYKRGNRTIAKEKVYKYINKRIRELYPGFNIGTSTARSGPEDKWLHPYRHWSFVPNEHIVDTSRAKRRK